MTILLRSFIRFHRVIGSVTTTKSTSDSSSSLIVFRQQRQFLKDKKKNVGFRFYSAGKHPMSLSSVLEQSTPDLCDDYEDCIRIVDPTCGFYNMGGKAHFGGKIVTVKCHEDNSLAKELAKTMNGMGKVLVVDGGGSRRRALMGDQVASDFVKNGWEGIVINGSIRDVDEIRTMPLGVQALGPHPCKTQKRNEGQTNIPVSFGGVTFCPDEYVVCDNNGIVVLNEKDIAATRPGE